MLKSVFNRKRTVEGIQGRKVQRAVTSMVLKNGSKKGKVYLTNEGKQILEKYIYDI